VPTLRSLLTHVLSDRKLTSKEWEDRVLQAAEKLPRTASPQARELLRVWASDTFDVEDNARAGLRDFLRSRGYPVPYERRGDAADLVRDLAARNVGEPDPVFKALSLALGRSSGAVPIAVLDTGFDESHPELEPRRWTNPGEIPANRVDDERNGRIDDVHGWNFDSRDRSLAGTAERLTTHGTAAAAVATSGTDRIKAITCAVPLRVDGDATAIADAIDYAVGNGARVVNMSFYVADKSSATNTPGRVETVRKAMLRHPQALFVLAAGNNGASELGRPGVRLGTGDFTAAKFLAAGSFPNAIVVAAADDRGAPTAYTNHGPRVSVAAPADHFTPANGGGYEDRRPGGTSLAAPVVANLAAKCLALDPALDPLSLGKILSSTCDQSPEWKGRVASGGTVNPDRAQRFVALRTLVGRGLTPEAASKRLKLAPAEKAILVPLLKKHPPPVVRPPRGPD
jgi:subtilisin family serine protease